MPLRSVWILTLGVTAGAVTAVAVQAQSTPSTASGIEQPPPAARRNTAALLVRSIAMPRPGFVLTSPAIRPNARLSDQQVYNGFGCTGQNISPALMWQGAPAETKSYAITVYDPDAPTGSGFWHWLVYNIPAATTSLPAGAGSNQTATAQTTAQPTTLPAGAAQGPADYGVQGYGGPCPPAGDAPHRYIFTVYALKVEKLDLPPSPTAAVIGFTLHGNTLATASLIGRYGR